MKRLIKLKYLFLFPFTLSLLNVASQVERRLDIPVTVDSKNLHYPFLGGVNNPQFSKVDLNNDGVLDLYYFDKIGNVSMTFITNVGLDYIYAPEYAKNFPKLSRFVLLRDYDGDGIQDIFALDAESGGAGLQVHKGYFENDTLKFNRLDLCCGFFNIIYYEGNSGLINLLVPSTDYPAIEDIDRDGDLDILTFSQSGFTVDYFQNLSVERGYGLDSLQFVKYDDCWGGFAEVGLTTKIDLSDSSGSCANNLISNDPKTDQAKKPKHAGSTISVFDTDGDGDVEAYLGDISFDNISELHNAGDSSIAWMNAQDNQFPSYDVPVSLSVFPASYFIDLDNDDLTDFIVASHNIGSTEDYNGVWYYKNVGNSDSLVLELQTKSVFAEEAIDLGSGAHPAFVDENGDGLIDIVVGNFSFFVEAGGRDSRLFLFRNVGSDILPAFELVDTNYLDFAQFNPTHYNYTPSFGDIDGDGDLDLVVGTETGKLFFAENQNGSGNALSFGMIQSDFQSIDVGVGSSPSLIDLDSDGLADLVVGERSGNLNYFRNVGSTGNPGFNSEPEDVFFGEVDVRDENGFGGYSTPAVVITSEDTLLLVGSESGPIYLYEEIQSQVHEKFDEIQSEVTEIRQGWNSHPALYDIDMDGFMDLLVGNQRGGLSFFKTQVPSGVSVATIDLEGKPDEMLVYPNPVSTYIQIESESINRIGTLQLFTLDGKMLKEYSNQNLPTSIDISDLMEGIYLLRIATDQKIFSKRIIKIN